MRHATLKDVLLSIALLISAGYTSVTLAHSQIGNLGNSAAATDIYEVTCSPNSPTEVTNHLEAAIEENTSAQAGLLSVMIFRGGKAINSTDTKNGDMIYSPFVKLGGGDGVYTMFVTKTKKSSVPQSYILAYHCKSAGDVHTGTSIIPIQNQ